MRVTLGGKKYRVPKMDRATLWQIRVLTGMGVMKLADIHPALVLAAALAVANNMTLTDAAALLDKYDYTRLLDAVQADLEALAKMLTGCSQTVNAEYNALLF